jgi:hypothetical protein
MDGKEAIMQQGKEKNQKKKRKSKKGSTEMPPTGAARTATRSAAFPEESASSIVFVNPPRKHLNELTGNDIPPGIDPDDLTIECEDLE